MTTMRQIKGLIEEGQTKRLIQELVRFRGDIPAAIAAELQNSAIAAVAVAAIRLIEIDQTQGPLFASLLGRLLATQGSDGLWDDGDPLVSALAARALLGWPETRPAALRAIHGLAALQRDEGGFPRTGPRRLPADPLTTAFLLVQLGEFAEFAGKVRLGAALFWLGKQRHDLPPGHRQLARQAVTRSIHHIEGQARKLVELAAA